jgi:uncharacterized protein (TIGR02145 family)
MKISTLACAILLLSSIGLFAQSGIKIHSGGAVTVNGNLTITPVWVCGNPFTDTRDGNVYSTVLIGTQCWFAQNLNIGTKIISTADQANNSNFEKYCFNDDENNCTIYGGLYQWDEAMQYSAAQGARGICPVGWHLPTDAQWTILTTFLGGESVAGGKMKEDGSVHWTSPNTGATNSSSFTALPGGYRYGDGYIYDLGNVTIYWSSSASITALSWGRGLRFDTENAIRSDFGKTGGFSVRCLKD